MKDDLDIIVARARGGDNKAYELLVDKYASKCYGYFYRLTGRQEISNDLLGELFLKLVSKIRTFKGGSFDKWIFTIASNIFRDYLRSKYRHKKMLDVKSVELKVDRTPRQTERQMKDKLDIALERLDDETRELLMMRFYGEFSFRELAAMRSEPIGTTLAKVHRGLKKLRRIMEAKND